VIIDRLLEQCGEDLFRFDLEWRASRPRASRPKDQLLAAMATFPRKPSRLAGRCYWVAIAEVLKFYPELKRQVLGEDDTGLAEMDDSDGGTVGTINDELDEAYGRLSGWERYFDD
jgi:hypothetical protein